MSFFSGDRFFLGNERKYFTHIPGTNCHLLNGNKKKETDKETEKLI